MSAKRKRKKTFNWNIVFFILTFITLAIGIFSNWNQKEINLLKSELDKVKRENEKLEKEVDPEWYNKFNSQKNYYEGQLNILSKTNEISERKIDSLQKIKKLGNDTNSIVLPKRVALRVMKRLLIAEQDSIQLKLQHEQNGILLNLTKLQDSIVKLQENELSLSKSIMNNYESQVVLLGEIVDIYKQKSHLPRNNKWNLVVFLLLGLTLVLIVYVLIKGK